LFKLDQKHIQQFSIRLCSKFTKSHIEQFCSRFCSAGKKVLDGIFSRLFIFGQTHLTVYSAGFAEIKIALFKIN
jgi:hypothetical protein